MVQTRRREEGEGTGAAAQAGAAEVATAVQDRAGPAYNVEDRTADQRASCSVYNAGDDGSEEAARWLFEIPVDSFERRADGLDGRNKSASKWGGSIKHPTQKSQGLAQIINHEIAQSKLSVALGENETFS